MCSGDTDRPCPKLEVAATISENFSGTLGLRISGSSNGTGLSMPIFDRKARKSSLPSCCMILMVPILDEYL